MNPSGLVIIIAGVWVACQVLGGDALTRLGITGVASSKAADSQAEDSPPADGGKTTPTQPAHPFMVPPIK
ncbi:hypothetical protein [Kineosporia sp. A_224]|uniref:hypothetical protein n=1 Tax=Kineosporia sp. A_224 TaxID=1962180 RepID=UPI000B4AA33B|nr:hypothetical protein [Kineosporia sp. A_224]